LFYEQLHSREKSHMCHEFFRDMCHAAPGLSAWRKRPAAARGLSPWRRATPGIAILVFARRRRGRPPHACATHTNTHRHEERFAENENNIALGTMYLVLLSLNYFFVVRSSTIPRAQLLGRPKAESHTTRI